MRIFSRKKEEIVPTVKDLISDVSGYFSEDVHANDCLSTDLGMDPLDQICLIMECEKHFNIKINDEDPELDNIFQNGTVKDFSDYITKLIKSC